jgi:hypothetical protein
MRRFEEYPEYKASTFYRSTWDHTPDNSRHVLYSQLLKTLNLTVILYGEATLRNIRMFQEYPENGGSTLRT